ncbi:hypothetical protein H0H92_008486, partial [Tricholoma furcatifolium]
MGLVQDMQRRVNQARKYIMFWVIRARDYIYKSAFSIGSTAVEDILKPTSSVPTVNAFIDRLGSDFPLSEMLVVDFLHEIELGVWKLLFVHLIRVLYAAAPNGILVNELDRRFREIPTFGIDTIRRFSNNTSEMKKLAARDFEDILVCAIPSFEGLLPEPHNQRLMKLLYRMAEWHALAKLRMHTDSTLRALEDLTKEFGQLIRQFRDLTCNHFATFELPKEINARSRRRTKASNATKETSSTAPEPLTTTELNLTRKPKTLNLSTYKFHAMGDYVAAIRRFGCTDSFSTQVGELAHKTVKRLYGLTNKKDAEKQIAKRVRRMEKARMASKHRGRDTHQPDNVAPVKDDSNQHYIISHSRNSPVFLYAVLLKHRDDPAYVGFLRKLQDHILGRLLHRTFDGDTHDDYSHEDRNSIRFVGHKIFSTKTCRVNYTTYDVRRATCTINPHSHPDVMVNSPEGGFWYARVIGIYHTTITCSHPQVTNQGPQNIDFLWVRWFGTEPGYRAGSKYARLPKIGFVDSQDEHAFTFLDPGEIVRDCHIIPTFRDGRSDSLLPFATSVARVNVDEKDDWINFYVGIFADRDMYMRHRGGGVGYRGNLTTETATDDQDVDLDEGSSREAHDLMELDNDGGRDDAGHSDSGDSQDDRSDDSDSEDDG